MEILNIWQKEALIRLLEGSVARSSQLLAKLSHTPWGVMSSSINEIPPVRLLSWFSRESEPQLASRFKARPGIPLDLLVFFPVSSAQAVTEAFTRSCSEKVRQLPDLVPLTIAEVSNILAQGAIATLADEVKKSFILPAPETRRGSKAQLLESAFEDYDGRTDILMLTHVDLYSERLSAQCSMVIMANAEALRRLLPGK
ncbi:MAG: hypothetical protein HY922_04565 [Elusimicrobia bacterium]|nr:hypothetical protein [Elusimicrobiota bacterium]